MCAFERNLYLVTNDIVNITIMNTPKNTPSTRREFVTSAAKASALAAAYAAFPTIIPASVLGKNSPSNRINVAAIGVGRISRYMDMLNVMKQDGAQLVAACDIDINRAIDGKKYIEDYYTERDGKPFSGVATYQYYPEMFRDADIDAVIVSTPDHWHAKIGIDAVEAGLDVFLQKPASLTIAQGRALSDAVHRTGRILQIGSQQRSWKQFHYAAERVRNGRIGDIKTVYVGLPGDPEGGDPTQSVAPSNLDYNYWLGSTPYENYAQDFVHPNVGYDRPGWLRCEQFGAGMITGWGAHHIDTAHWGMDTEYTGPIEIWGNAKFASEGLWNVHGDFRTEALYANGVKMIVSSDLPNGIKWEGTKGSLFVTRGTYHNVGQVPEPDENGVSVLEASDPKIITSEMGPDDFRLNTSDDHTGNWLDCVRSRKQPIAPAEIGHRSCSTCLLHHMAMKVDRHLHWNPAEERFIDDDEANTWVSRPERSPYGV